MLLASFRVLVGLSRNPDCVLWAARTFLWRVTMTESHCVICLENSSWQHLPSAMYPTKPTASSLSDLCWGLHWCSAAVSAKRGKQCSPSPGKPKLHRQHHLSGWVDQRNRGTSSNSSDFHVWAEHVPAKIHPRKWNCADDSNRPKIYTGKDLAPSVWNWTGWKQRHQEGCWPGLSISWNST